MGSSRHVVPVEGPFDARATDSDTMLLRGKSFKTQFHGATHVGALIAYVPELAKFTKVTFETFPAFARIRYDMKSLENRTVYAGTEPTLTKDNDLKDLLASRAETDHLIQLYLDSYDTIYHVLHAPTFRKDYNEMWANLNATRPHVIALVLVMSASSQLLSTTSAPWLYTGNSSNVRERAIAIIRAVEDWLQTQSQKHVTVLDFQIRFILLLAKRITVRKAKRQWTETNRFLTFCISAGLHRNPDFLRKPTVPYDKELRRRMWAAACEFELQIAFERGMVSSSWPLQSDCPPPSNIGDDDFDPSTEHLSTSRPAQQFTEASCLAIGLDTLALRHSLNTALNNIRQPLSFDEGKRYTEEIETHLKALPRWIGASCEGPRAMLEINLRQYTLAIHNRLLRHTTSQTERNFSRFALLENSIRIVDIYKSLAESGPPALQLLREDLVRAACSVSHVSSTLDPSTDNMIAQVVNSNAEPLVEDVIVMLTDNIGRYGREQRQLWIVLAANGFMKTSRDPASKLRYMQEAVDKITKPYYRIIAGQGKEPSSISDPASASIAKEWSEKGFIEYLPNDAAGGAKMNGNSSVSGTASAAPAAPLVNNNDDPPLLDLEELAAWTFEDWAFTPGDWDNLGGEGL